MVLRLIFVIHLALRSRLKADGGRLLLHGGVVEEASCVSEDCEPMSRQAGDEAESFQRNILPPVTAHHL